MWLFTIYGFFSASVKGRDVWLRARNKEHLEALMGRYPSIKATVQRSPNRDYAYRIKLSRQQYTALAERLAADQTWDNFKDAAKKVRGKVDPEYLDALHDIWGIMLRYQTHHGKLYSKQMWGKEAAANKLLSGTVSKKFW